MTNQINQPQVIRRNFRYIQPGQQSGYLAGCSRKQYVQSLSQISLYLQENVPQITLYIFTSLEFISLFSCCGPFMDNAKMVRITRAIDHSALIKDPIRECNKNGSASTGSHLLHLFMPDGINLGEAPVIRFSIIRTECADTFAQTAIDTTSLVNHRIQEAHTIRLHRDGIRRTNMHASRTAAAAGFIRNLYHRISFRETAAIRSRIKSRSPGVQPTQ